MYSFFAASLVIVMAALTAVACSPLDIDDLPADAGSTTVVASDAGASDAGASESDDKRRPAGWDEASHSNDVDPNYAVVFPVDAVNTITITIAPVDWAAMQADMDEINAVSLPIREAIIAAGPDLTDEEKLDVMRDVFASIAAEAAAAAQVTATEEVTSTGAITAGVGLIDPAAVAASGAVDAGKRTPMWVPATIAFQDRVWTHVGVRYKGVSSLNSPWVMGDMRLPFKFDFDEFEDDYPEIKDQRFFGFKQLSLANNFTDPSGMRDTVVYDILEAAGLPSLQTAPYEIVLDYGDGPIPLGLYTVVEVVDDTGIATFFGDDHGNIYEGDGLGASLAPEYVDLIEEHFEKKNNEVEADWSDVRALFDVLHDARRTSDPQAWRTALETVFDVDAFLAWVGIRAIVGHWDSYGGFPHNFYLYNNPDTGQLTWISWDHNMTFTPEKMDRSMYGDPMQEGIAPLMDYLLDDPVYQARYRELLAEIFAGAAAPAAVVAKVQGYAELIAPYAAKQMTPAAYADAVQVVIDYVEARSGVIEEFLATQP